MDRILDHLYKDLQGLLTGQIVKQHVNQPAFLHASVDFVIGANHGHCSSHASIKLIFRNVMMMAVSRPWLFMSEGELNARRRIQPNFWH
jgi:hypothetical protein